MKRLPELTGIIVGGNWEGWASVAEYGLIVAKDSYVGHVEDADSSELAIDTRLLVPKIHLEGSGTITPATSGTMVEVTIAHGLGYAPDCEVYLGKSTTRYIINGRRAADQPTVFSTYVDGTNLKIEQQSYPADASTQGIHNYYYYIFKEDAD